MMHHVDQMQLVDRIPEKELMENPAQVKAYAEADFSAAHAQWVEQFEMRFGCQAKGEVLDLGCGPGDVALRFVRRYPQVQLLAVDGSEAMIEYASRTSPQEGRIQWAVERLPLDDNSVLLEGNYDCILSNNLLHHLQDPGILWREVLRISRTGTQVLVGDLVRPTTKVGAATLVETYATQADPILKRDFFDSLCAAYQVPEVQSQLKRWGLTWMAVEQISDRHMIIWGVKP